MRRNAKFGALVFAVLLVTSGLSGVVAATPEEGATADTSPTPLAQETGNETTNATASVTFSDQSTNGSFVFVNATNLSQGGYVAIFAQNGTMLGNTSYLEPGAHENLTVELDVPVNRSQVLVAVPHKDTDDDQMLEFNTTQARDVGPANATDGPYLQSTGLPVSEVAFVIVGNQSGGTTATAARPAVGK